MENPNDHNMEPAGLGNHSIFDTLCPKISPDTETGAKGVIFWQGREGGRQVRCEASHAKPRGTAAMAMAESQRMQWNGFALRHCEAFLRVPGRLDNFLSRAPLWSVRPLLNSTSTPTVTTLCVG